MRASEAGPDFLFLLCTQPDALAGLAVFFPFEVLCRDLGDHALHALQVGLQPSGVGIGPAVAPAVHLLQGLGRGLEGHNSPTADLSGADSVLATRLGQVDAGLLHLV